MRKTRALLIPPRDLFPFPLSATKANSKELRRKHTARDGGLHQQGGEYAFTKDTRTLLPSVSGQAGNTIFLPSEELPQGRDGSVNKVLAR